MIKVGLISLGCAKNLIDSEVMIGHLNQAGMTMTADASEADVVIVNTCTFIDNAKKESIAAIYEAVDGREEDKKRVRQKVIVAGCMAQRFNKELPKLMPQVDAFIGLDQITQVVPIINRVLGHEVPQEATIDIPVNGEEPRNLVSKAPKYIPDYDTPRFRLTARHTAYIKIAEGCNHPCTFCIIPQVRGRHRSRTVASVVAEARRLVAEGVKELNLISQDTTYFGMDKWTEARPSPRSPVDSTKGESLATLLRELNAIEGDFWIRLLYTHPAHWSDELIQTIAECPKVARYVDIPLQHISDNMLNVMQRETSGDYIRDLIKRMRKGIPGIAIRTTFIVGFPGETEADFEELLQFIEEARFERAGIFKYSREEGTRAYKMPNQVHHKTKDRRWNTAMALLQQLNESVNAEWIGRDIKVLVEKPGQARSERDAMEIDGLVYVDQSLAPGTFAQVKVRDVRGYDLVA